MYWKSRLLFVRQFTSLTHNATDRNILCKAFLPSRTALFLQAIFPDEFTLINWTLPVREKKHSTEKSHLRDYESQLHVNSGILIPLDHSAVQDKWFSFQGSMKPLNCTIDCLNRHLDPKIRNKISLISSNCGQNLQLYLVLGFLIEKKKPFFFEPPRCNFSTLLFSR